MSGAKMTLDRARQIVGRSNASEPFLSNMIMALGSLHAWLNTPEENERLAAARIVRAAQRAKRAWRRS